MKVIVILISGRGSNLSAILGAKLPAKVAAVISNNPDALGLKIAANHGIPVHAIDHRNFSDHTQFEESLIATIDAYSPDLVVLAGFMRILTDKFVNHFRERMVNIHPSLLPAFTGLKTHRRALDAGVKIHGCSVHFVTSDLDGGPIIAQAAVAVLPGDDEDALAARVLEQEHRLYPETIRWFLQGRLSIVNGRVQMHGECETSAAFVSPICTQ